jgi:hypothetical protein
MPNYEVSRTLVKSPPELWEDLRGERLSAALTGAKVRPTTDETEIAWEIDGACGTAALESSGWGTKVTLTAYVEDQVARLGVWARMRGERPPPPRHPDMEQRLEAILDELGSARRRPFSAE